MGDLIDSAEKMAKSEGVLSVMYAGLRGVAGPAFAPILVGHFVKEARNVRSIGQSLDFALSYKFMGVSIAPVQVREEIDELLRLVGSLKPHTVLEIGTASGGTLFLFTRVATDDAEVISIDLPEGESGEGYPAWKSRLFRSFALDGQKVRLIRADSHSSETLNEIRNVLDGRPVDFLFIDGDHTYEGVRRDFEMYSPFVREGGIIAFHDICPGPVENVGGVPDFWQEIITKQACKSIVKDHNQGGYGIGVLNQ